MGVTHGGGKVVVWCGTGWAYNSRHFEFRCHHLPIMIVIVRRRRRMKWMIGRRKGK